MKELDRLRAEIDRVDEELFKLFFRRLELVSEIGHLKKREGLPVTDERREVEVRERWRSLAKIYGIPETLADNLLSTMFSVAKMREVNPSEKRRITLVGYGGMARSLASLFKLAKHEVVITGRSQEKSQKLALEFNFTYMPMPQALQWGEIVILALPPEGVFSENVTKFLHLSKGKVVMDILSSKMKFFGKLEEMSKEMEFRFVSTHPLFGPYLNPVGEKIVLIPSVTTGEVEEVSQFWRGVGLTPLITDVDTHEKLMAIVQVLPHFFIMGLSRSLELLSKELNVDFSQFQTTNFREIYKIVKRVKELEPVILEIQKMNPYAEEARRLGLRELNTLFSTLQEEKK
ncbi:Chorismate mutase [Metallosphaera sp. J1]|uniref:chorismate mutase n=1 Tax=Metallosphaera javensis (ex Hofmann et al. 2022) TaxID=99938 RepID=UPI001EDCEB05|nr:chorismate mutase [Metallosphaera javensis (ex Hofmann et al. 2022)]MCG3109733.1 Chorismate mutase [Metallosphaera javensis (ex Hofmann et al. 2022)]